MSDVVHGHCRNKKPSPTYYSWRSMKFRCLYPQAINYQNYGGRGITVCDRWLKFENFLEDMGERPDGLTLSRINNDGNYEPTNCCWDDPQNQAQNRRTRRKP